MERSLQSTSNLRRTKVLRKWSMTWLRTGLCCLAGWLAIAARGEDVSASRSSLASDVEYNNYRKPAGPWSIHVVRVPRGRSPFQIHAVHAGGSAVGLGRVSEQVALEDSALASGVAAINGDFYQREGPYAGDPRGLQIVEGELISAPTGGAAFWIDAAGEPHTTNVFSMLQVTWPGGSTTPVGLNEDRSPSEIVLYTPTLGASTRTIRGREIILEPPTNNSPWPPLRQGRLLPARVREVRDAGDTRIAPGTMVLSIGAGLARTISRVQAGAEIII